MRKARAKLQRSELNPGVNIKAAMKDMSVRLDSTVYVLGEGTFGLCVSVDNDDDLESGCALKLPLTAKRKLADSSDAEFAQEVEVASGFCRIDTDEDIRAYRGLVPCLPVHMGNVAGLLMPRGVGNLKEAIFDDDNKHLLELSTNGALYDLLNGVARMHEMGYAHQDLKPENVIVFLDDDEQQRERFRLKIGDFGSTRPDANVSMVKSWATTTAYLSLEGILAGRQHARSDRTTDDVWALGCILYEMVTQKALCRLPRGRHTDTHQRAATRCVELLGSAPLQDIANDQVCQEIRPILCKLQSMPSNGTVSSHLSAMANYPCHQDYIYASALALKHISDNRPITASELKFILKRATASSPTHQWGYTTSEHHVYKVDGDCLEVTEEDNRGHKRIRVEWN